MMNRDCKRSETMIRFIDHIVVNFDNLKVINVNKRFEIEEKKKMNQYLDDTVDILIAIQREVMLDDNSNSFFLLLLHQITVYLQTYIDAYTYIQTHSPTVTPLKRIFLLLSLSRDFFSLLVYIIVVSPPVQLRNV